MTSVCEYFLCDRECLSGLVIPSAMSTLIHYRDVVVDVIELSFRSRLVLMPREHAGAVIGSLAISDSFIGFTYIASWLKSLRINLSTVMYLSKSFLTYGKELRMS